MADARILFFIDEHLPASRVRPLLEQRGHVAQAVQVGFKDPSIIATADIEGAVIITADGWFLSELFRYPVGHPRAFLRAGVVKVAGEWDAAQARLIEFLPVIEHLYPGAKAKADPRFGMDLSETVVRIGPFPPRPPRKSAP